MKISMQGNVFAGIWSAVSEAASTDLSRPILTGVLFEGNEYGGVQITACDSYRIHTVKVPESLLVEPVQPDFVALVSAHKADNLTGTKVRAFCKPKSPVTLSVEDGVHLEGESGLIHGRLIDGEYPNWRGLMVPKGNLPDILPAFNEDYLASACKGMGFINKIDGHLAPIRILSMTDQLKPALFGNDIQLVGGTLEYRALLMPVRVA